MVPNRVSYWQMLKSEAKCFMFTSNEKKATMTEDERKKAIDALDTLRRQGILTSVEYIQKIAQLNTIDEKPATVVDEKDEAFRNASKLMEQSEYNSHYVTIKEQSSARRVHVWPGDEDLRKEVPKTRKKKKSSVGKITIAVLLIALIGITVYGTLVENENKNSTRRNSSQQTSYTTPKPTAVRPTSTPKNYLSWDMKVDAMTYAQAYVKTQLKAPSTAKFPSLIASYSIARDGDQYTVKSYVDAENSFGAKIRSNYECCFTMIYNGSKIETKVVYIKID